MLGSVVSDRAWIIRKYQAFFLEIILKVQEAEIIFTNYFEQADFK